MNDDDDNDDDRDKIYRYKKRRRAERHKLYSLGQKDLRRKCYTGLQR